MTDKPAPPQRKGGYLTALLTSCPAAIIAINSAGIITFVNNEACKLVEREMCDMAGESITTIYGDIEVARETNRQLWKNHGTIRDHESTVRTKSGKTVPVRISAAHMKDSQGNYAGAVGFFEVYRPWHSAEIELKKKADRLETKLAECRDLGAPIFELYPGISAVVIAGPLDTERFQAIADNLLNTFKERKSRVLLIDISTAQVDDAIASQVVKVIRTIHLLGAECVIAGCQTPLARAMEPLVSEVSAIKSFCDSQPAIESALGIIGYEIIRKASR